MSKKVTELSDNEMDELIARFEKQADRSAAWGMFASHQRQQNYSNKLAELRREFDKATDSKSRNEAQKKIDLLKDKIKSDTTYIVGGY